LSRSRLALFSLIPALLLFVMLEGGLRLAGFRHEAAPVVLRFGYPDPAEITDLFRPDPDLFWRLRPGSAFDAEATVSINAAGYRGAVPQQPRPPGLARVAVLGDSVAFGFGAAWPEILGDLLAARMGKRRIEVLNFGVPGYSVVQGVRQFDADVAALDPDVVLIAYGWNDHWLARGGLTDADRRLPSSFATQVVEKLTRLRTVQASCWLLGVGGDPSATAGDKRRVPDEVFRERLAALIGRARERGAEAIVVGLPAGFDGSHVPSYLVEMGFTPTPADAVRDHERYVDLARVEAESSGATFIDLRKPFASPDGTPRPELFSQDGIHPSAEGHALVAAVLEPAVADALDRRERP